MVQKRDTQRYFNQTQKNEILYQQNYICAQCKKKLDPRAIHYHHIKPWAAGGRTITQNGAAVCPNCHAIIGHKMRLKQEKSPKQNQKNNQKRQQKSPLKQIDKALDDYNKRLDERMHRAGFR